MTHCVALSLSTGTSDDCLAVLYQHREQISRAEICLDLLDRFDLRRLLAEAPCPLIITCRPLREGGAFAGSEQERLAILTEAVRLGCAYIDVEWDALAALALPKRRSTQVIVSRHWFTEMPTTETLWALYTTLRTQADVVKLVGTAHQLSDTLPIFALLHRATTPVIGLAMGAAGQLTRLLAPCFASCLLTFAAVDEEHANAPGQLALAAMTAYGLQRVTVNTPVVLHPATAALPPVQADSALSALQLMAPPTASPAFWQTLQGYLPQLTWSAVAYANG